MYFRSTTFWLFWLTFVSMQYNQLNMESCFGAALRQPSVAIAGDLETELAISITTTTATMATMPTTLANKPHLKNLKHAKNSQSVSENFAYDFKANLAKIFASNTTTTTTTGTTNNTASENQLTGASINDTTLTFPRAATTASATLPHLTVERRHVVPEKLQYTKEINIKQGRLMGIVRNFHTSTGLRDVDQYLGLPYAEAPVGSRRFMPPGTPLPWQDLRIARHLPPVCPQKLPDLTQQGSTKMSRGYYKHIMRLLPYLKNESEDCLYLNVYVPRKAQLHPLQQPEPELYYPVVAYVHGESFEWNSGNAYDGSVLSSYGDVIVVTINYRLGIMGFLKPGIDENIVANFGLLDQIAALHWIKENIASFGGDKDSVTLMGHSTGAACVNYLMLSPVASGLFHRAILMSGSAMSDWAASNHSLQITMQIAHSLNCPLNDDNEEMLSCLRQKRYQDILKIPTTFPQFSTSLGPIVDGHVIPNQPYKAMGQNTEHFSRYDLLFGITESESYHALGALALEEGLRENERDNLLRFYMQSRFDVRPDLALAATLKKYNDMYNNPIKASNLEHRDVVLDILSDARVVGPLMQTGLFHADVNRRNYMYVFGHNSAAGPHASLPHSITGEELAFVFGAPLAPAGPFHNNYGAQEKLLAEAVMSYWTNFAKTGNPKAPWKDTFINLHALEWDRYDLDWPEYNKRSQAYLNIGIPPSIGYKYRQIYMNFWNKELPDELNQIAAIQKQPYLHASTQLPRGGTSPIYGGRRPGGEVITGHMSKFGTRDRGDDDPVRTLKLLLQEPYGMPAETAAENMYNAPPTFGVAKQAAEEELRAGLYTIPTNVLLSSATPVYGKAEGAAESAPIDNLAADKEEEIAKSETTIQLLIGIIVVFIVLNVIIYASFLLQKRKKRGNAMKRKLGGILSYDGATDDELKRSKQHNDGDESYILDVAQRKSNTYEAVKTERSPINGFKMSRQLSTSTVDTHTKVCAWMAAGNAGGGEQKLSGTLKRLPGGSPKSTQKSSSPTFSSLHGSGSFAKHAHKVSVAVDATPQARTGSILSQEPIELTKYKIDGRNVQIICQDVEVDDQELLTPQSSLDASRYSLMRQHSAATEACETELPAQLTIAHQHSRSDPVEMYYNAILPDDEKITSFIDADKLSDINVTSRDELELPLEALTPEQQLLVIKRRNYPKVLPTGTTEQRSSDSPPMTADLSTTYKRNSLPPNSYLPNFCGRQPPMPPPRTISTLGRKHSTQQSRRNSNSVTTSPLMLAQDCAEDEDEPPITQNTLIVGPIVPKSGTLKRKAESKNVEEPQAAANEVTNCGDNNKFLRRPPTLRLTPLTAALSGSFQTFESRPKSVSAHELSPPMTAAHHTEKVYAIEATTPTTPRSFTTPPTTPTTAALVNERSGSDIYAQPMKLAIKSDAAATIVPKSSGIPRIIPATTTLPTTVSTPSKSSATNCNHVMATLDSSNQAAATTTRIPQPSSRSLQQCNANIVGATNPTSALSTAATTTTTTTTATTTPNKVFVSQPSTVSNCSTNSTCSTASSCSASSRISSASSATSSASSSASSANTSRSSSTSSSSSSTGTVRTELQQK